MRGRSANQERNQHDRENMDRVLTTHTGSLIRPRALAELMTAGPPPDERAREHRDQMIADAAAEAVRAQVEVGLAVCSCFDSTRSGQRGEQLSRTTEVISGHGSLMNISRQPGE